MSKLGKEISMACTALGIPVELGYTLTVNGNEIRTVAWIPDLCGPKGMLIVTSSDALRNCSKELVELGYGYSVMSEHSENSTFDLSSWCEVFCDWGWTGDPARKPRMMTQPPLDELRKALLHAQSDELKEQAAQKIANVHWEVDASQQILFDALHAGPISVELQSAFINSLADIWIRRGGINKGLYDQLASSDLREILAPWFEEVKKEMHPDPNAKK